MFDDLDILITQNTITIHAFLTLLILAVGIVVVLISRKKG